MSPYKYQIRFIPKPHDQSLEWGLTLYIADTVWKDEPFVLLPEGKNLHFKLIHLCNFMFCIYQQSLFNVLPLLNLFELDRAKEPNILQMIVYIAYPT